LLTVLLDSGRIFLPVLLPVLGVAGAPFPRTVAAPFAIFGIGDELFLVLISTPFPLASGFAADGLAGLELRWREELLTVAATPLTHNGGCLIGEKSASPNLPEFRNCCKVSTASPPMAQLQNRRNCCRFSPATTRGSFADLFFFCIFPRTAFLPVTSGYSWPASRFFH